MRGRNPVPWIGLLALVAMFVISFLPDWIFEGPRMVRHWPRRHICGACGAGWTSGHVCEAGEPEPVPPDRLERLDEPEPALRAWLDRDGNGWSASCGAWTAERRGRPGARGAPGGTELSGSRCVQRNRYPDLARIPCS